MIPLCTGEWGMRIKIILFKLWFILFRVFLGVLHVWMRSTNKGSKEILVFGRRAGRNTRIAGVCVRREACFDGNQHCSGHQGPCRFPGCPYSPTGSWGIFTHQNLLTNNILLSKQHQKMPKVPGTEPLWAVGEVQGCSLLGEEGSLLSNSQWTTSCHPTATAVSQTPD